MYNINDIINDLFHRKNNYTKQQFMLDYCKIAKKLDYSPDVRTWPKGVMFKLLNIKLDQGDEALEHEIQRLKGAR